MKTWHAVLARLGVVAMVAGLGPVAAQQPVVPTQTGDSAAEQREKLPLGLYFSVGIGTAEADEVITSVDTTATQAANTFVSVDDQDFGMAAVGWKLREGKGDFRLMFNGYKENEFNLRSVGSGGRLSSDQPVNLNCAEGRGIGIKPCLFPWWSVAIEGGVMRSQQFLPEWEPSDLIVDADDNIILDANGQGTCVNPDPSGDGSCVDGSDRNRNGLPDPSEWTASPGPQVVTRQPESLQNQAQTVDLVYGREFGRRRVSSRWWVGLRYFKYTGNMAATAWLATGTPGVGFTDGVIVRPFFFSQDTTGTGPTGSWQVDFNFFDKGIVLFLRAQTAFLLTDMSMDSGTFLTVIDDGFTTLAEGRISDSRDKSVWHNTIETGVRIGMRNGLGFELAWSRTGFLDAILVPTLISIPTIPDQAKFGTSALVGTEDYIVDRLHGSVSFQF